MAWYQKPRTESQCLPAGEFDAKFVKIEKTTSKKGNTMVAIELEIDYQGRKRIVKDWIVQGFEKSMAKVGQITKGLGLEAERTEGTFRLSEQLWRSIRVMIGRKNDQKFGWQNEVVEYKSTGLGLGPDIPPAPGEIRFEHYPDPMDPGMPF